MLKISKKILAKRLFIYCLGIFLISLGVAVSVKSNLGVSPLNSIPKVLSEIFTSVSMGTWTFIIFCCYILIQLIILRGEFHLSRLLQILCSCLFGFFVDYSNSLCSLILPDTLNYAVRLIYLIVSMALIALGILLYLAPNILSMPGEGVMQVISEKSGMPFYKCKIIFDVSAVIIAVFISLLAFGRLNGVREGTIIATICVGKFLGVFTKLLKEKINRFIELNEPQEALIIDKVSKDVAVQNEV